MIFELFVLGGVAFWVLSVVVLILLLWAASDDRAVASGLLVAGYIGALCLFGDGASLFRLPPTWVFYIGIPAYFLTGTAWGIGKWALHVDRQILHYKEERLQFLLQWGLSHATIDTPVPNNLKTVWRTYASILDQRPIARRNKRRIVSWMCFWPTSMIWAVIDEPWRRIYNTIASILQKIADKIYERAGIAEDMRRPDTLMDAIEGHIQACGPVSRWDAPKVAHVIARAFEDMDREDLTARATVEGHVIVEALAGHLPKIPGEIKGITIDIVELTTVPDPGRLPLPRRTR